MRDEVLLETCYLTTRHLILLMARSNLLVPVERFVFSYKVYFVHYRKFCFFITGNSGINGRYYWKNSSLDNRY